MTALDTIAAIGVANALGTATLAIAVWRSSANRRPLLLRGTGAIARRLRMKPAQVEALRQRRQLPVFRVPGDGAPHATAAALDDWRRLWADTPAVYLREASDDAGGR